MTPTKLLIGQILFVFGIVIAGIWLATQWAATALAYQPQLGPAWFVAFEQPIYRPWSIFPWWYRFDAYAPHVFDTAGSIAAASGFVGCGAAVFGSLWRARQSRNVTTYGSAKWASTAEMRKAGLFDAAGVLLGRIGANYVRHDGPEHVMAFAPILAAGKAQAAGSGMPWEQPLQQVLESVQGPVAKIVAVMIIIVTGLIREKLNAVEAWLSSLPGHAYANVRQPLVHTLNLAHLMPLSSVWAGPHENAHLGGPPLLHASSSGSTPFRLSTHVGDVGHTRRTLPRKPAIRDISGLRHRRLPCTNPLTNFCR
jgi:TrbC/VIRB2 pilin